MRDVTEPINNTVTITEDEYKSLLDDAFWRTCLEHAGVDNWDGFDWAMEEYHKGESEED